jgi:short-subunit dehydrogenase
MLARGRARHLAGTRFARLALGYFATMGTNGSRATPLPPDDVPLSPQEEHVRPLALVTGASSGIGLELAKLFAEAGYDLIVAADSDKLAQASETLQRYGAHVDAVQVDLARADGVEELYRHVRSDSRPLDSAALNAGVGAGGEFAHETRLEDELRIVDLNVRSTMHLAKHVVRDMVDRGHGRILFTSSIGATTPGPFQAAYAASKAFLQSFALALRNELKDSGVTVTVLMPGPTDTDFFKRAHMTDTRLGSAEKDDPAQVARDGFEALMGGEERVVSHSLKAKVQGIGSRVLPDGVNAELHRKQAEPHSG